MKGTVERIENSFTVVRLDDGRMLNIEANKIPKGIKRGQVIEVEDK